MGPRVGRIQQGDRGGGQPDPVDTGPGYSIACRLQASHAATHPAAASGATIAVCRSNTRRHEPRRGACRLHKLLPAHPASSACTMGELLSLGYKRPVGRRMPAVTSPRPVSRQRSRRFFIFSRLQASCRPAVASHDNGALHANRIWLCRLSLCNLPPVAAFSIFSADPDLSACTERGSPASSETELYISARTERGCRARDRPAGVVARVGGSIGGVVLELERELARLRSLTCHVAYTITR